MDEMSTNSFYHLRCYNLSERMKMNSLLGIAIIATFFSSITGEWAALGPPTACMSPNGCGTGFRLRIRQCLPFQGPCVGESFTTEDCWTQGCLETPPTWSEWSDWSSCSQRCDAGMQYRVRHCQYGDVGNPGCDGDVVASQPCSLQACPEHYTTCYEPTVPESYRGNISQVGSRTCKRWAASRSTYKPDAHPDSGLEDFDGRTCRAPNATSGPPFCQTRRSFVKTDCSIPICGEGAIWSEYTTSGCTKTCGGGVMSRVRQCLGGLIGQGSCTGSAYEGDLPCNTLDCPPVEPACVIP